jgi:hypothetical protein
MTATQHQRPNLPLRPRRADVPVDCTIAHLTGPTIACATCELNKLRDQSKPAKSGWLQACVITLSIALPVILFFVIWMLVTPA